MESATFLFAGSTWPAWAADMVFLPIFWSSGDSSSAPHPGRLDRQPLRPPGEVQLEVEVFGRSVRQHLGVDSREAGAQAALQRTQDLPLQAISGVGVRLALADSLREQPFSPLRVVTVAAREIHLSPAQMIGGLSRLEMRSCGAVYAHGDPLAARLARDVSGDGEELLGFVPEGLGALVADAAGVDAPFEVEQPAARRIDARIARRDAAHARARVLVAARARPVLLPRGLAPDFPAALHPQHPGIGECVVLERAQVRPEKRRAGLDLIERNGALLPERSGGQEQQRQCRAAHALTWMDWRSDPCLPSSSTQVNSSSPLASATV